jgi:hypothetical protein
MALIQPSNSVLDQAQPSTSQAVSNQYTHDHFLYVEAQKLFNLDENIIAFGEVTELQINEICFHKSLSGHEQTKLQHSLSEWKSLWRLLPQSIMSISKPIEPLTFQAIIGLNGQKVQIISRSLTSKQYIFLLGSSALSVERAKFYLEQSIYSLESRIRSASLGSDLEPAHVEA